MARGGLSIPLHFVSLPLCSYHIANTALLCLCPLCWFVHALCVRCMPPQPPPLLVLSLPHWPFLLLLCGVDGQLGSQGSEGRAASPADQPVLPKFVSGCWPAWGLCAGTARVWTHHGPQLASANPKCFTCYSCCSCSHAIPVCTLYFSHLGPCSAKLQIGERAWKECNIYSLFS